MPAFVSIVRVLIALFLSVSALSYRARLAAQSTLKTGGGVVIVRRDLESDMFNWKLVDLRTWHHQALL